MYKVLLLSFLVLFGCKPKDDPKTLENKIDENSKEEKAPYLDWKKRISFGENIVSNSLDSGALNISFDSFYKYVGENDGYVCGKLKWTDKYRQKEIENYYYIYLSFLNGRVSSHSEPMVFDVSQEYPLKKYKMFCSLN
ncbi:hypothetical protein V6E05_25405 [Citrobacter freundii]|uniref:hypothetical protein n=1 Tax=Citrobacter freundii TaxID=546 RepID=UPI00259F8198|nr:hypothetical protein [Citrobacter freundii]EKV2291067.1 hypothetical protein [Citrobacter freundii]